MAIWAPQQIAAVEASTKSGKTVGCIAWQLERVLTSGAGNINHWWVAPVYTQSEIAYRRVLDILRRSGIPDRCYSANDSKLRIDFAGAGHWWFKSAEKPDNLYGEDVYSVVEDEASRMREAAHHAILSTMTYTRAPLRSIGNTRGRGWWYKLCRQAESGDPDMAYHKITCEDAVEAGVLSQEAVDLASRQYPEAVFRELYYCEPSDDGSNPFGISAIEGCTGPLSTNPPAVFGVDLAKYRDWTVVIGLDADGKVCRMDRWQAPWDETETRIANMIGSTPTLIDSTGVGDPIVERLSRYNPAVEPYQFTAPSKQKLMQGLAASMQQRMIQFPDGPIRDELETFEYQLTANGGVRYGAPEGLHDDCVCALALANHHRTMRKAPTVVAFGVRAPRGRVNAW